MSAANQTSTTAGRGEERTVRIVPASIAPRAPREIKAASSVFAAGAAAKPQRKALDVNTIEIKADVPLPPNSRSGPSKYAALLARMPKGSMVERLTAQADEWNRRYMALLQQVADGRAMQPAPAIVVDLGPNVGAKPARRAGSA